MVEATGTSGAVGVVAGQRNGSPGESPGVANETVARDQLPAGTTDYLNSANCGLIIHRVGQVNHQYREQAADFARTLQQHNNAALTGALTAFVYEEVLGTEDRLHWLMHMKAPNDYGILLEMVEHDQSFKDISLEDRLPEEGGGNWERMFVEATFQERVIVPQHGLTHADDDEDVAGLFAPPARFQSPQPADALLHSGNAGAVVHRTAQVRYALRKEGRDFAFAWQDVINRRLPGEATVLLYEETWGRQDRIHWLVHLRTLDAYRRIRELEADDDDMRRLLTEDQVPAAKGGGPWGAMFVDGSIRNTVLVPQRPAAG